MRPEEILGNPKALVEAAPPDRLRRLALSPEEAFILSRVVGPTTVVDVIRSCGLPESTARVLMRALLAKGGLVPPGAAAAAAQSTARDRKRTPYEDYLFNPAELNEPVELELERRKEILYLYYQREAITHYRLLGILPTATPEEIRYAYLERSKQFHPDTYFRKRLGTYLAKIEDIFQRLRLAYETLSDPERQRKYDREHARLFSAEEQAATVQREIDHIEEEKRSRVRRERLLHSRGFARLTHARALLEEGDRLLAAGSVTEASEKFAEALRADPKLELARARLLDARRQGNARRVEGVLESALRTEDQGDPESAARLLRGALDLDDANAQVRFHLARVLLESGGDLKEARGFAQRAVDLGYAAAEGRCLLGEILLRLGLKKNARRELEAAAAAGSERAGKLLGG